VLGPILLLVAILKSFASSPLNAQNMGLYAAVTSQQVEGLFNCYLTTGGDLSL